MEGPRATVRRHGNGSGTQTLSYDLTDGEGDLMALLRSPDLPIQKELSRIKPGSFSIFKLHAQCSRLAQIRRATGFRLYVRSAHMNGTTSLKKGPADRPTDARCYTRAQIHPLSQRRVDGVWHRY